MEGHGRNMETVAKKDSGKVQLLPEFDATRKQWSHVKNI